MQLKVRGRKKLPAEGIERVLVRGTNWIGDVVMTLPALAAIRKTWPEARISILAKPWVAEVYRLSPDADEVIVFAEPGRHAGAAGKLSLAGDLRRRGFDCAILLQNAIEAAILALLAGIPLRAGYNSDGRGLLLTHSVRRTDAIRRVHQIDYYLEMVRALGCAPAGRSARLRPGEDYDEIAAALFARFSLDGGRPLIGIAPGAAYGPAKKWFSERFASVADRLIAETGAQGILFGSAGDRESTAAVRNSARRQLTDIAGETNLKEAIALINRCDLFLSNDSGLMHVAGALGIPTVAIFGSTNPATTSPVGEKSVVIHHDVDCGPCLKPVCPTDFRCMEGIGVEEVYAAARKLLGEKRLHAAVFLDRDGTINEEVGYLDRIEKLRLIPGAAEAIRLINASGMKAVVVTNQSGVARGFYDEAFVEKIHARLREILRAEGAFLDGLYFCPHHPTEGREDYLRVCDCRKPAPGLLLRAARELRLDLARSYMIGDTLKDIEAGTRTGMKGVIVRTGYGGEELLKLGREAASPGPRENGPDEPGAAPGKAVRQTDPRRPDYVAADVLEAVEWILRKRP